MCLCVCLPIPFLFLWMFLYLSLSLPLSWVQHVLPVKSCMLWHALLNRCFEYIPLFFHIYIYIFDWFNSCSIFKHLIYSQQWSTKEEEVEEKRRFTLIFIEYYHVFFHNYSIAWVESLRALNNHTCPSTEINISVTNWKLLALVILLGYHIRIVVLESLSLQYIQINIRNCITSNADAWPSNHPHHLYVSYS